jgi:hypothetical protein
MPFRDHSSIHRSTRRFPISGYELPNSSRFETMVMYGAPPNLESGHCVSKQHLPEDVLFLQFSGGTT